MTEPEIGKKLRELEWEIRLSALYHLKRERFLDGLDRASSFVSAIGGAAAFAKLQQDPELGLWITGVIAVVSMMALVYGPAEKARRHSDLARDFRNLEVDLAGLSAESSFEDFTGLRRKYLKIQASEPPALGALVTHCHNELCEAIGTRKDITPLPLLQRLLKNWFDFDQSAKQDV